MGTTVNNIVGIIYVGLASGAASPVDEVREWTIDTDTNDSDDGQQGDIWQTSTIGRSSFDLSITTNIDTGTGGGRLQKHVIARDLVKFYAYFDRAVPTVYWYGTGVLGGGGKGGGMEDTATAEFSLIPQGQPGYIHP